MAVLIPSAGPDTADAEEKLFQFVKVGEMGAVRTVVVNDGGTRFAFVTGQNGAAPGTRAPEDIGEQAKLAMAGLDRELKAAGFAKTDVIKLTIYVKNLDLVEGGFVLREVQTYFGGARTPLITWVGVMSLVLPQALVEVEAMAVARR